MKNRNFIDVNGLGHSGKGAVSDILREVKGCYLNHHLFEFDLIRIQGGLIDLKHNIHDHWSPIRSDAALKRFIKVAKRMSTSKITSITNKISSYGTDYESRFNQQFNKETDRYINNLIIKEISRKFWPYTIIDKSMTYLLFFKLLRKLNLHDFFFKGHDKYFIVDSKNFINHTHSYINNLFVHLVPKNKGYQNIILHNTLEPYNTISALELIPNLKVINVVRDPRDTFASTLTNQDVFIPNYISDKKQWEIKKNFLSTKSINDFIAIQKMNFENYNKFDNESILNLKYEDVVLNYEKVITTIFDFLEIDKRNHINKGSFFDPKISKKNVGIWKRFSSLNEIKLIEKELDQYCYK